MKSYYLELEDLNYSNEEIIKGINEIPIIEIRNDSIIEEVFLRVNSNTVDNTIEKINCVFFDIGGDCRKIEVKSLYKDKFWEIKVGKEKFFNITDFTIFESIKWITSNGIPSNCTIDFLRVVKIELEGILQKIGSMCGMDDYITINSKIIKDLNYEQLSVQKNKNNTFTIHFTLTVKLDIGD